MIIRYVKVKGKPIGCVIGVSADQIGWSLCCKKDIFNKKMARLIAEGRAISRSNTAIPQAIIETYDEVYNCLKGEEISIQQSQ